MHKFSHGKIIFALIIVSYFLLMFGNSAISLTHPDEVFYIQTSKEMMIRQSWSTPYIFGSPQFEKPIFAYWLFIFAMKLFGITAFGARFMPALFGILGVIATYVISFLMFRNKKISFLSGIILATSFIWLALSRAVLTDMIFSVWVILSLGSFYYGYVERSRKNLGIIFSFVFAAIAVLTKGILGIIFPFGVILIFLLYKKELKFFWSIATVLGLGAFFAIALPWHVAMYKQYGGEFINEYWGNVHVRRIFEAEHQKSNTWYFYLMTIFAGIFPWSFLLAPTACVTFKQIQVKRETRDALVFILIWIVWVCGLMQVAHSKLASYIAPIFPAIAILIGNYFYCLGEQKESLTAGVRKLTRVILYIFAACLLAGCIAAVFFAHRYIDVMQSPITAYVFSGLLFVCFLSLFIFILQKKYIRVFISISSMTTILLISLIFGFKHAEPWVSCKQICDIFKTVDNSAEPILTSKFYVRGIKFYTDRDVAVIDINGKGFFSSHPMPFLSKEEDVVEFLEKRPVTYCIVKKAQKEDLERIVQDKFKIIFIEEKGGKYILKVEKI